MQYRFMSVLLCVSRERLQRFYRLFQYQSDDINAKADWFGAFDCD